MYFVARKFATTSVTDRGVFVVLWHKFATTSVSNRGVPLDTRRGGQVEES